MNKQIFDIGSGRYFFDRNTLDSFIEEARSRHWTEEKPGCGLPSEAEVNSLFEEVMSLYREYQRCQSVDLLVTLKCKLQEFSVRYESHVLAEEVLHINSCLPYEHRMSTAGQLPH